MYHYAANNPVKYTDPDGEAHGIPYEVQKNLDKQTIKNSARMGMSESLMYAQRRVTASPTMFDQRLWTQKHGFEPDFNKTACFATSLLNIVSIKYTKTTGKVLNLEQGNNALNAAINAKYIDKEDAYVSNIEGAVTSMLHSLGLNYHAKYTSNDTTDNNDAEFKIYAFADEEDPTKFRHFVNACPNGEYFDVFSRWDGSFYNEDGTPKIPLQEGRPIRALNLIMD